MSDRKRTLPNEKPRLFFTTVGLSTLHRVPPEITKQKTDKQKRLAEIHRYLATHLKAVYSHNPDDVLPYSAE